MKARGYQDKLTEWLNFFYKDGRVRRDSRIIANTAQFLSRICPQKEFILRGFVRADIEDGPEYWCSRHLDLYDMDDMIWDIIRENFDSAVIKENMSIRELLKKQNEMREHMLDLSRDFLNNIWLYQHGIFIRRDADLQMKLFLSVRKVAAQNAFIHILLNTIVCIHFRQNGDVDISYRPKTAVFFMLICEPEVSFRQKDPEPVVGISEDDGEVSVARDRSVRDGFFSAQMRLFCDY